MKFIHTSYLLAASLLGSSISSAMPVATCHTELYSLSSGALLSSGDSQVRVGSDDLLVFGNPSGKFNHFRLNIFEVVVGPGGLSGYDSKASDLPSGVHFNNEGQATGGSFVGLGVFGKVSCEKIEEFSSFYQNRVGKVLAVGQFVNGLQFDELSKIISEPEAGKTCVGGDIAAVAQSFKGSAGKDKVAVVNGGIRYDLVKSECLDFEADSDLPSGGRCLKSREVSRVTHFLKVCND